jgi:hypothetical protein
MAANDIRVGVQQPTSALSPVTVADPGCNGQVLEERLLAHEERAQRTEDQAQVAQAQAEEARARAATAEQRALVSSPS